MMCAGDTVSRGMIIWHPTNGRGNNWPEPARSDLQSPIRQESSGNAPTSSRKPWRTPTGRRPAVKPRVLPTAGSSQHTGAVQTQTSTGERVCTQGQTATHRANQGDADPCHIPTLTREAAQQRVEADDAEKASGPWRSSRVRKRDYDRARSIRRSASLDQRPSPCSSNDRTGRNDEMPLRKMSPERYCRARSPQVSPHLRTTLRRSRSRDRVGRSGSEKHDRRQADRHKSPAGDRRALPRRPSARRSSSPNRRRSSRSRDRDVRAAGRGPWERRSSDRQQAARWRSSVERREVEVGHRAKDNLSTEPSPARGLKRHKNEQHDGPAALRRSSLPTNQRVLSRTTPDSRVKPAKSPRPSSERAAFD